MADGEATPPVPHTNMVGVPMRLVPTCGCIINAVAQTVTAPPDCIASNTRKRLRRVEDE